MFVAHEIEHHVPKLFLYYIASVFTVETFPTEVVGDSARDEALPSVGFGKRQVAVPHEDAGVLQTPSEQVVVPAEDLCAVSGFLREIVHLWRVLSVL